MYAQHKNTGEPPPLPLDRWAAPPQDCWCPDATDSHERAVQERQAPTTWGAGETLICPQCAYAGIHVSPPHTHKKNKNSKQTLSPSSHHLTHLQTASETAEADHKYSE